MRTAKFITEALEGTERFVYSNERNADDRAIIDFACVHASAPRPRPASGKLLSCINFPGAGGRASRPRVGESARVVRDIG
ncbi:hypothetical protein EVAR_5833_1 [Eumeta japonica]|uniref:Uncharacterized protein n=1 Tax=Eumeta variegata TaxID=151549 RepID=A0A4C1TCX1_EUMVA|nr:hypothetical protein EVAR_5833_1 [Eumeta japonica]